MLGDKYICQYMPTRIYALTDSFQGSQAPCASVQIIARTNKKHATRQSNNSCTHVSQSMAAPCQHNVTDIYNMQYIYIYIYIIYMCVDADSQLTPPAPALRPTPCRNSATGPHSTGAVASSTDILSQKCAQQPHSRLFFFIKPLFL